MEALFGITRLENMRPMKTGVSLEHRSFEIVRIPFSDVKNITYPDYVWYYLISVIVTYEKWTPAV